MSTRYKGSVLSATAATNSQSAAVGIWRPNEVLQAVNASLWPLGITYDPYFKYVTLLLHGDGTNGAQNNTFLDSSTNNFTITRNGNTTQGTFTPYGNNWSNYFNGSTDYLTVASNAAFQFSTGDFTIELWFYMSSLTGANQHLIDMRGASAGTLAPLLYVTSGGVLYYYTSGANQITGATLSVGQWYHIALARSGTSTKLFVNGTQSGSTLSDSNNYVQSSVYIGRASDAAGGYVNGYESNVRLVKGTAVYTTTFTPSTTPLTAISGTSLLTCQSNRFIDNSTNAFAITRGGSPSIQRFSPFSPPTAYSTNVIGGSGYFDGSGDYLTVPDNTAFDMGSGNFTVEAWIYPTAAGSNAGIILKRSSNANFSPFLISINTSTIVFGISTSGSAWAVLGSSSAVSLNAWHHVALVRNGTAITGYVDGVSAVTGTVSGAVMTNTSGVPIGQDQTTAGGNYFTGYIEDARIVKGTAVYTAAFTPPTAPLTAITNTSLLLSYTNAGIYDNAMMNDLETVGDAQVSTSVKKFGTGSMAFDGTGDYLKQPTSVNLSFGSGDFTLECWAYFTSVANFPTLTDSRVTSASTAGFNLGLSTAKVQIYSTSQILIGATALSANTWYHIAVTRASGTLKIWLNGVQDATVANSTNWSDTTFLVGATPTPTNYMTGYIDDLRITKGYARYTATFTPPTAAFPNQ